MISTALSRSRASKPSDRDAAFHPARCRPKEKHRVLLRVTLAKRAEGIAGLERRQLLLSQTVEGRVFRLRCRICRPRMEVPE